MSVVSTSQRLTLRCDGRPRGKVCQNHYSLNNDLASMKAANEYLERHGWRTKIDGYVQLHYCAYCANSIPEFNPKMKVNAHPQTRVAMSAETKQKLSEKALAREERRRVGA